MYASSWRVPLPIAHGWRADRHRRITLTITNTDQQVDDQDLLSLEVYPEMTIDTLRDSIKAETGHLPISQHLYYNGKLVTDLFKHSQID